jgi:Flp pilus assembly pilin Flp
MNTRRHTPDVRAESGQTMTEYAFILALIFAVVVISVPMIGTIVTGFFTSMAGGF